MAFMTYPSSTASSIFIKTSTAGICVMFSNEDSQKGFEKLVENEIDFLSGRGQRECLLIHKTCQIKKWTDSTYQEDGGFFLLELDPIQRIVAATDSHRIFRLVY